MTKINLINYLIDCKGYSEEEARNIVSVYGTSYLSEAELEVCKQYNS